MTNCPTCGKPVDPLRARAVSVRDGKVIAFCSQECKAAAETRPIAAAAKVEPAKVEEPVVEPTKAEAPKPDAPKAKDKKPKRVGQGTDPVIEIVHEPATGVVTSAPDRRDAAAPFVAQSDSSSAAGSTSTDAKPAMLRKPSSPKAEDGKTTPIAAFKLDEFKSYTPAEGEAPAPPESDDDHDDPDRDDTPRTGGSRIAIAILVIVLLGGGAVVAYRLLSTSRSNAATHDSVMATPPPVVAPPDAAAPPALTAPAALEHATTFLRGKLTATPKIALAAAAALARTKDEQAIATLAKLLPQQTSDIGKLVVAYQLARGGDPHGRELLAADLTAENRERRLEAARWLARLGDPRATAQLLNYMEYAQFRLNIAVLLAETKEPKALKALDEIVANPTAPPDDKVRATIALAVAGRTALTPKLHELLADNRFNTEAAEALAKLHDGAARPVLEKQLGVSALRVTAARSLRMLEPALDSSSGIGALLEPLVAELDNKKDTEQVGAAEALLLLAGPAAWSEHE